MDHHLYVIARRDLYQLGAGKLAAQVAHAASMLAKEMREGHDPEIEDQYREWEGNRGFGTTIVLMATEDQIVGLIKVACNHYLPAGVVVDPTYPFTNVHGEVFTAEEMTCGYVFLPNHNDIQPIYEEVRERLQDLPLYPSCF